jgi:hypothetical protein
MAAVTWSEVLTLPAWPSLRTVAPDAVTVKNNLMRVGKEQFALVTTHDRELRDDNPEAPFVTSIIWAPNENSALRCALHDIDVDDVNDTGKPPRELLPFDTPPTYAAITEAARTKRYGDHLEHAEYRIGTSGKGEFVHKIVEVGRIGYCFRSSRARKTELPYAIRISLLS